MEVGLERLSKITKRICAATLISNVPNTKFREKLESTNKKYNLLVRGRTEVSRRPRLSYCDQNDWMPSEGDATSILMKRFKKVTS